MKKKNPKRNRGLHFFDTMSESAAPANPRVEFPFSDDSTIPVGAAVRVSERMMKKANEIKKKLEVLPAMSMTNLWQVKC